MRRALNASWLAVLCLALGAPVTMAEPINYLAGGIYQFQMTSTGAGSGPASVSIVFGPGEATFKNGAAMPPGAANLGGFSFTAHPVKIGPPDGSVGQVLYPMNQFSGISIDFGSGIGSFQSNLTMGSVELNVASPIPGGGLGQAVNVNPYPAVPPGQNGMTFLGEIATTGNTSSEDLSLFGPDSGGLFALTLLVDDPNFNFAAFINAGGTIDGQGAFQMIGGVTTNTGTEVPEPLSLALWLSVAGAGFVTLHRRKKLAAS